MKAITVTPTMIGVGVVAIIIGLAIAIIPTIIAVAKDNENKMQVFLLNIICFGISIIYVFLFVSTIIRVIRGEVGSEAITTNELDVKFWIMYADMCIWIIALLKAIRGR
jgi:hypothetical protein